MGKVKIKKKAIWIDMTPMSDVMVLLLTFFMLTSTFVKNEAVKVLTPGSVSELKVPENNVLSILIDSRGKVFLGWDKPGDMEAALSTMADQFGVSLNGTQMKNSRQRNQYRCVYGRYGRIPESGCSSHERLSER